MKDERAPRSSGKFIKVITYIVTYGARKDYVVKRLRRLLRSLT